MDQNTSKLVQGIAVNAASVVFGGLFLALFLLQLGSGSKLLAILFLILFIGVCVGCIMGNMYVFGPKKSKVYNEGELKTIKDYQNALANMDQKCFSKQIDQTISQLSRLDEKLTLTDKALQSYFGGSQISYSKYKNTIDGINALYLDNLLKEMNRISLFDYPGYVSLTSQGKENSPEFEPYKEHIIYVNGKIDDNEKILTSLDHLMIEIAKLDDSALKLEDMSAMHEIQDLISNTKLYKH